MIPFEVFRSPRAMREKCEDLRRDGLRIGLVPTMGALHEGHLSLLRTGRSRCDILVLSIFVNPTQFSPNEDLTEYPRSETEDLKKARSCGVDLAFCPRDSAMYHHGHQTEVTVVDLAAPLCGRTRPGHFAGVATVVTKLFHIVQPHLAVFGEKDFQQLVMIRQMVKDLDFAVQILSAPIVREADGLAMSSRNRYLSQHQRRDASALYRALKTASMAFQAGERSATSLLQTARQELAKIPSLHLEYLELRDARTLSPVEQVNGPAVLATAATVGDTRLIDNIVLK